ncbi:MAG: hypothetical protein ACFFC7_07275 [Candidatus Hermodarchaeota archaeon]
MLPDWFLLRPAPDIDIGIDEWTSLAEQRINFLLDLNENLTETIRKYRRMPHFDVQSRFLGHLMLRLVAAKLPAVRSWFIETEGDLFGYHFRSAQSSIKRKIAEELFGGQIKLLHEFKRDYPEDEIWPIKRISRTDYKEYIAVHFSEVPWLVSSRKVDLSNGWVIISWRRFFTTIKHKYEQMLRLIVLGLVSKIEGNPNVEHAVKRLQSQLNHIQLQKEDDEGFHLELDNTKGMIDDLKFYPPCMAYLQQEFEATRYLTHSGRLQLGWFLKRIGMNLDDQIQFWWQKSADNVGKSFDQFLRRSGYQIRHIYGLEGSRTDYDVPKCKTCISRYFCAFAHLPKNKLKSFLLRAYGSVKVLPAWPGVQKHRDKKRSQDACAELFSKVFNDWPYRERTVHPLQWTKGAYQFSKNQKSPQKDSSSENDTEGIEN